MTSKVNKSPKQLQSDIKHLEEDLTIALNALRFYGNRTNWIVTKRVSEVDRTTYFSSDVAEDNGQRARITADTILKVRKHKQMYELSKYTYNDGMLEQMGYQIMALHEGFIIAESPKRKENLFHFAGKSLKFTINIVEIDPFENKQLARIAISNHINRKSFMIKNKPKGDL